MRQQEADECNEKSRVKQWQESLERALTIVTSNVVKATSKPDSRQQNSLRSDIRKRINTKKKAEIGGVQNSIESYQSHYQWVTKLNEFIVRTKEVPLWLS